MTRELTQRELRNESGEIMRALDRGEEFIVTRNGVPVGELRPIGSRYFVPTATFKAAMESAPHVDHKQLRADLDAIVDPSAREWPEP
ncbi:MAG: hypothetical protein H0X42_00555 [Solirubrobacterales bacterium]|nr:hypothetical protein [Solirubrobacterales bacterium]